MGRYWIDLVVEAAERRAAVECDGDRYHPIEKLLEDMERQAILERLGWRFIRIRGSVFFRNPDAAIDKLVAKLDELGIHPSAGSCTSRRKLKHIDPTSSLRSFVVRPSFVCCGRLLIHSFQGRKYRASPISRPRPGGKAERPTDDLSPDSVGPSSRSTEKAGQKRRRERMALGKA